MDFKQIEAFVAIAKLNSFSKAADALFLTQPTISTHIKNLEYELQTTLVNRSSKNVCLTEAGEIFFRHAIDMLNKRDRAVYSLNDYKGRIEGILEISASSIPERHLLPDLLVAFRKDFPDVRFKLMAYDSGQILDKILRGEIDFGIVGSRKTSKPLAYSKIMKDEIVLVAPPCEPYLSLHTLTTSDLTRFSFIVREEGSGSRKALEKALSKHGIALKDLSVAAFIENNETILECVKKQMGLTFISEKAVREDLSKGRLIRLPVKDLPISRDFHFVYNKNIALSPLAETFKTFVESRPESRNIR